MIRKFFILLLLIVSLGSASVFAETVTATANGSFNALVVFSLGWERDGANVTYPDGGPLDFDIKSASRLNRPRGYDRNKPDIAWIAASNENRTWGIKMNTTSDLLGANTLYYMEMPTLRGQPTTGALGNPTPQPGQAWPAIPQGGVIYTSGNDTMSVGTYGGMSIGIDGRGLTAGGYSSEITFTMIQNP